MRMDKSIELTAEEIINRWPEEQLARIFREYGEEPRWKKAAKAIVEARRKKPIRTTTQLADVISNSLKTLLKGRLHPATLIFQALRIAVNRELDVLADGLAKAIEHLAPNGKVGVTSFHRLEDRIVKNIFKSAASLEKFPGKEKLAGFFKIITKKPLIPSLFEVRRNPRARSAKMRFAQRC